MAKISALDDNQLKQLEREVQQSTRGKTTLETAARAYSKLLYDELKESIVLTRLFATVPMQRLPPPRQQFVTTLAASAGVSDKIDKDTLALSLLGTQGDEPQWNEALQSKGHVAIPLATSAFVDSIPMVSRLLHQVGAGVEWIDRKDTSIVARALGMLGGVFYVEDAASEVDSRGRKIIAAQDFVSTYGVQSVFGFGGGYANTSIFIVSISFLRETIAKSVAERFLPHVNRFKVSTMDTVARDAIFDP